MKKSDKILVVMHIYYSEQTDLLLDCLNNITYDYDLYVTMGKEDKSVIKKIKKQKPKAHFIISENVGYDIWPFIKVINDIDLSKYKYIVKLHTKRDMPGVLPCPLGNGFFVCYGDGWRDDLLAFIKTKDNFKKCIDALEQDDVGMCTRYNLIHGMANHCGVIDDAKKYYPQYVFGLKDFSFVAGTMFISKIKPIQMVKDKNISVDLFEKPTKDHRTQFAHVIERTIGEAVYKSGMKIVDPFTSEKHIKYIRRWYKKLKMRKVLINIISCCIPIAKIRRHFRAHLMNTSLYLSTLKRIVEEDRKY